MFFPESFCNRTCTLLGNERWETLERALGEAPTVSVRCNPWKGFSPTSSHWQTEGHVPWCEEGIYLKERPSFTFDPLLHAGAYYVQEASSMFVVHVVRKLVAMSDERRAMSDEDGGALLVLDMCAAPGGKSTAMLGSLPSGSMLFANEPVRLRANILAENLSKYGYPHVVVTNNYPKDYERSGLLFDMILCDVPCSGEGMFRKDAGAIAAWSEEHVKQCSQLQREIVSSAWKCLRPGGFLIYSTCTFNREENEDNIRWMVEELGARPVDIPIDSSWGIQGSVVKEFPVPCYRFLPGYTKGEGLFMAAMYKDERRATSDERRAMSDERRAKGRKIAADVKALLAWLEDGEDYEMTEMGGTLYGVARRWSNEVGVAKKRLHVIQAGVAFGERKGRDMLPDVRLALSTVLGHDAFPCVELDYEQAMAYLRRESLLLTDAPRGMVVVSYQGQPLGFVKNLGTRANNLYPKEWRVRRLKD